MSQWYQLVEFKPFREPWTPKFADAKPMQTYFCKFEGISQSVMLNKQEGNVPQLGMMYGAMEMVPGKEYLKFKGEKAPDGVQPPAPAPQLQDMGAPENVSTEPPVDLKQIHKLLDEINQKLDKLAFEKATKEPSDMSKPVDLSEIPF